jgi:hypothetical protein
MKAISTTVLTLVCGASICSARTTQNPPATPGVQAKTRIPTKAEKRTEAASQLYVDLAPNIKEMKLVDQTDKDLDAQNQRNVATENLLAQAEAKNQRDIDQANMDKDAWNQKRQQHFARGCRDGGSSSDVAFVNECNRETDLLEAERGRIWSRNFC